MSRQLDPERAILSQKRTWDMYSPAVSSPLNPNCTPHGRETPEGSEARALPGAMKTTTATTEFDGQGKRHRTTRQERSPTEILLRQKAEVAWRSIRTNDRAAGLGQEAPVAVVDGRKKRKKKKKKQTLPTAPEQSTRPPPVQVAHWEDQDDQFFVNTPYRDDDNDDDNDDATSRWSFNGLTDLNLALPLNSVKIPMTRRSLLVAMLCLGGCIPALAILSATGPSAGIWAIRQPTVRTLIRQAASLDIYGQ